MNSPRYGGRLSAGAGAGWCQLVGLSTCWKVGKLESWLGGTGGGLPRGKERGVMRCERYGCG